LGLILARGGVGKGGRGGGTKRLQFRKRDHVRGENI